MKLCGMLSKIMDNYLCLRGIASIKALAEISEINPDIQRNLLEEHKDEMKDFLEQGEYAFFPEVVLSMSLDVSDDSEDFHDLLSTVDSADKGLRKSFGKTKISVAAAKNKLIDERKQVKVAQFEFEKDNVALSRIDGNHRLSAAAYLKNDVFIPFCLIIFSNEEEAKNNSRVIFHNINSKQIPLKLEQNIKIIIESEKVFPDSILEKKQPFGVQYKFTRELLCGTNKLDFSCFPHIEKLVYEAKYSFFIDLFKYLLKDELINEATAVNSIKRELSNIEDALSRYQISSKFTNSAIVGALAYYRLSSEDKYSRFIKWVAGNHIAEASNLGTNDVIKIFDKVYDNIPKKIFLARWYPAETNKGHSKAVLRLDAIKNVANNLGLELVDIGTRLTGTFDIRSVMYREITQSDIFIADLSGSRHNVMVEVGYALKHVGEGRMAFYFQPQDVNDQVPFDISGFMYDEINDSAEIKQKVQPRIETIIANAALGEIS